MVSVQALVTIDDAAALLRAYAFANARPITDVSSDVVRGELRFS
jgi:hypothetical protein